MQTSKNVVYTVFGGNEFRPLKDVRFGHINTKHKKCIPLYGVLAIIKRHRAQELCESRGGRPGLPSLINLRFLWTWSNTSTKRNAIIIIILFGSKTTVYSVNSKISNQTSQCSKLHATFFTCRVSMHGIAMFGLDVEWVQRRCTMGLYIGAWLYRVEWAGLA